MCSCFRAVQRFACEAARLGSIWGVSKVAPKVPVQHTGSTISSASEKELPVFVTGATGRLGRLLNAAAGQGAAYWQGRSLPGWADGPDWCVLDRLEDPAPLAAALAARRARVLVALAGVTSGTPEALAMNRTLALAALEAAEKAGLNRVFLLSSAAVYGRGAGGFSENGTAIPVAPYGQAKLEMEHAVADWIAARRRAAPEAPQVTILRLGNVAGADMLLGGLRPGQPARLDIFADGTAPARSYIGVGSLWRVIMSLADRDTLPACLNIAAPGAVSMAGLLEAATHPWQAAPAPDTALPRVELDTTRLQALVPFTPAESQPDEMVRQWRDAQGQDTEGQDTERRGA